MLESKRGRVRVRPALPVPNVDYGLRDFTPNVASPNRCTTCDITLWIELEAERGVPLAVPFMAS